MCVCVCVCVCVLQFVAYAYTQCIIKPVHILCACAHVVCMHVCIKMHVHITAFATKDIIRDFRLTRLDLAMETVPLHLERGHLHHIPRTVVHTPKTVRKPSRTIHHMTLKKCVLHQGCIPSKKMSM